MTRKVDDVLAEEEKTARALLVLMPDVAALREAAERIGAQIHALAKRFGIEDR